MPRKRPTSIIHEAEKTAHEMISKAEKEAGERWVNIVNQATEIANRTLDLAGVPPEERPAPETEKETAAEE